MAAAKYDDVLTFPAGRSRSHNPDRRADRTRLVTRGRQWAGGSSRFSRRRLRRALLILAGRRSIRCLLRQRLLVERHPEHLVHPPHGLRRTIGQTEVSLVPRVIAV